MKKPFIAIYTETRSAGVPPASSAVVSTAVPAVSPGRDAVTAALLVVFANRDAQTLDDVEGTKVNLEGQGEGVHVREFDFLREIPDLWDLSPSPAGGGEGGRKSDEGRGENPSLSADRAEANKIIAERASLRPVSLEAPNNPAIQPSINPEAAAAIHQCLKLLAGHCDGARTIDGAGFNKMDTEFGHSLANAHALSPKQAVHGQKLIRKYHRQLPADLLQAALGTDEVHYLGRSEKDASEASGEYGLSTPAPGPEVALRKLLTDKGVPQAKQDEIIADATAKAQPGAMVGPFQIPADGECVRTPAQLVNHKYTKLVKPGVYQPKSGDEVAGNGCEEYYGDTYQNGVQPGPKKLAQFREILELTGTPALYAQEGKGNDALVHVKLFDPTGSWTWFITEFDPAENTAFGLVDGHDLEVGYIDLNELANVSGRGGIGIEIDMHFKPQTLGACREAIAA